MFGLRLRLSYFLVVSLFHVLAWETWLAVVVGLVFLLHIIWVNVFEAILSLSYKDLSWSATRVVSVEPDVRGVLEACFLS